MFKFGSLRAICAASLLLSTGFFQSCVLPSDEPGGGGGAPSGGSDSTAGSSNGGSMAGTGAVAGVNGSMGGGAGALGGAGEPGGGIAGALGGAATAGSIAGSGESGGGIAGAVGGVGGAMGGTSGSVGGIAGSMSIGGCSNDGGSNTAGWPGQAGIGGSNVAGSEASGGAAGSGNGGQGGVAFAGASGSAAAGACADPSCAGMSGGAGAPPSAGNGGTGGDPSLPLVLSTNLINFPSTECGTTPTSKTLTITNPSSVNKTWRAVPAGAFSFLSDPTGSTLAPGGVVTVTVTPPFIPLRSLPSNSSQLMTGVLLIVDGAVYQTITLSEPIAGAFYSWTPANLNFGSVALNASATLHLTQSGDSSGRAVSDNTAFSGTYSALSWHEWTFTFNATTFGTQTATFTWKSIPYNRAPCTPDTFTATAYVPPQ